MDGMEALYPRPLSRSEAHALRVSNHRLTEEARRLALGALHGVRDALAGGKPKLAGDLARYAIEAVEDTARGDPIMAQLDREVAEALGNTEALRGELAEAEATIERQRILLERAQAALAQRSVAA